MSIRHNSPTSPLFSRKPKRRKRGNQRTARRFGLFESLEQRLLLSTFTVITTADSGEGSLRQKILAANLQPGPDEIVFDFLSVPTVNQPVEATIGGVIGIDFGLSLAGSGTLDVSTESDQFVPAGIAKVIRPATPLPAITDTLLIDAQEYSNGLADVSRTPSVQVDGTALRFLLIPAPAFDVAANNSSIRGFLFTNFEVGVSIRDGAHDNIIENNSFGKAPDGTDAAVNIGVQIVGSNFNEISGNLFVGGTRGISIKMNSAANAIQQNRISAAQTGILVDGSGQNHIRDNVIAGATESGILVSNSTGRSVLQGNRLVENKTGVTLLNSATLVGGDVATDPNYFRRNEIGLSIEGGGDNHIIRNRFGTNDAGTSIEDGAGKSLGNDLIGIQIENSADNILRGNQIAGLNPRKNYSITANSPLCGICSQPAAIRIDGAESINNVVTGNLVGVNASGESVLPNYGGGIFIQYSSQTIIRGNTVAGSLDFPAQQGFRAVDKDVLGYLGAPVAMLADFASLANGNPAPHATLQGNRIGTNSAGTTVLGNDLVGIVSFGVTGTIGGAGTGEGNVVSGNRSGGIYLMAHQVEVIGNYVGTDISGTVAIPNSGFGIAVLGTDNQIGGAGDGERNVISGNHGDGVRLINKDNLVVGNRIGVDRTGTEVLGNTGWGIDIGDRADSSQIGTAETGAGNIIGGNTQGGISFESDVTSVSIQGNRIGVGAVGLDTGNGGPGISIRSFSISSQIGGPNAGDGNQISNNAGPGVYVRNGIHNVIQGNTIGGIGRGNGSGIQIEKDVRNTSILQNEIKLNRLSGISVSGPTGVLPGNTKIHGNTISGNRQRGIEVLAGASGTVVGNSADGGNMIFENEIGVLLGAEAHNTQVSNNQIFSNRIHGVQIKNAPDNVVGGAGINEGNRIYSNGGAGIYVQSGTGNRLESNSIYSNRTMGIDLKDLKGPGVTPNDNLDADTGANGVQNFPVIDSIGFENLATIVNGTFRSAASTAYLLQFFSNDLPDSNGHGEGKTLLGTKTVTTDTNGEVAFQASFANTVLNPGQTVSAIAIAPNGDTSEFSPFVRLPTAEQQANVQSPGAQAATKVATDARGNFVVAWQGPRPGEQFKYTIWFRRFHADGTPLDDADREAPSTVDSAGEFDVAMDDAGNFVLVWDEFAPAGDEELGVYGRRFDAAGNARDAQQFHVNTLTAQEQRAPAVAMDADGDFVVVWQSGYFFGTGPGTDGDQYGIRARRFSAAGTALDANDFLVNTTTAGSQTAPDVAMDDAGNFVIVWADESFTLGVTTAARRFNAAGAAQGTQFRVDSTEVRGSFTRVTMGAGGDFAFVFRSFESGTGTSGIGLRRYGANGVALDAAPRVLFTDPPGNLSPASPVIAKDGEGNFLVAWTQTVQFLSSGPDYDVFVQRFSPAGEPLDSPTRVHDFTEGVQSRVDIAADPIGGYVVGWQSEFQDGSSFGAFYRTFGDHPDILLNSARTNGTTGLTVNYTIVGPIDGFNVSVYRSKDGLVNAGDALMTTVRISEPGDLTPGPHTKAFTIGSVAGEIPLPGVGAPEVSSDYQVLFAADVLDQELEDDADPLTEDNVARLTGVYHAPGGSVYVLGSEASDSVRITRGSVVVEIDGDIVTFPEADVTDVRVRAQEGDDEVVVEGHTVPLMAHGGAGQDQMTGGGGADQLSGGADEDQILGGDGDDMLDGGEGDDMLGGQGGNDELLGQGGNDSLDGNEGDDTMDGGDGENVVITLGNDTVVSVTDTVIADAVPSLQIPSATFSLRADSSIIFGGIDANRIAIVDPFPTGTLELSLSASRGTLKLASLTGLSLVTGTGTDDTAVTVSGELDSINSALNGLTFKAPSTAGGVNLQITLRETASGGQPLDSKTLSLTVLPSGQPVLGDSTFRTAENRPAGSVIGTLRASDPDTDQTLSYQILSGNSGGVFAIDQSTGILRVAAGKALDFETTPNFTFVVQVTDSGTPAQSDTATVTVEVLDANDPPVARNDTFTLGGSTDPLPLAVLANDVTTPDVGEELTISAITQPASGTVAIVAGKTLTYTPDTASVTADSFTYTVSDGRGGFDIASVSLTTSQGPTDIALSNTSVKERLSGATIGTLSASGPAAGLPHIFSTGDPRFEVAGTTLKLRDGQFLERSSGATVNVEVTVRDSGTPAQTLTKSLVIVVTENVAPWKNVDRPFDTNGDGTVAPLDVLVLINLLNSPDANVLSDGGRLVTSRPGTTTLPFYDPNGDGFCSPIDVLQIINFLNGAASEGESPMVFANVPAVSINVPAHAALRTAMRSLPAPCPLPPIAVGISTSISSSEAAAERRIDRSFRDLAATDELAEWESILDQIAPHLARGLRDSTT